MLNTRPKQMFSVVYFSCNLLLDPSSSTSLYYHADEPLSDFATGI